MKFTVSVSEIKWDSIAVIHPHKDWRFWRNCLFLLFFRGRGCYTGLLYCALQVLHFFFFKHIECLWQPCIKHVYQHHFCNSICSLHVCVSHFGNSCNISDFCYPELGSILFGVLFQDGSICCHPWFGLLLAKKLSKFNNSTECSC